MIRSAFVLCLAVICAMPAEGEEPAEQTLTKRLIYNKYKNPYAVVRNTRRSGGWIELGHNKIYHNSSGTVNITITTNSSVVQIGPNVEDMNNQVLAIRVAAMFRNNLIRVFGYILHRPEMELNSELYTSLYFILSTIKLNQVNMISIVPKLKSIGFKSSNERFVTIFEEMEKNLPLYLACAATFWKEAIQNKEVNMNNILKPDANGPLRVDVLGGMNDEMLSKVSKEEKVESPKNEKETKIMYNFNMDIVQIMRYIQQHKNDIHQLFIGALVLFFPRNVIQPDLEESIQVIIEFLQRNEIDEWKKYISELDSTQLEDPYYVVRQILAKLILSNSTTVVIKESLQIVLSNLASRNPTAINPHYDSITSFVDLNDIKLPYMLNYIRIGAYPIEIVMSARRIAYHLLEGHIKHITLMTYFMPYLYSSPTEILIALLGRILKRQPDLPAEITDAVGAVYAYVIYTYRYIMLPATIPDDMLNPNILFLGNRAVDLPVVFIQLLDWLFNRFTEEHIDFYKVLKDIPAFTCATPATCFYVLITFIQRMNMVSPETILQIQAITNNSCFHTQCIVEIHPVPTDLMPPEELYRIYNESQQQQNDETTTPKTSTSHGQTTEFSTRSTPTTTALPTTTAPTEGPVVTPTTLQPTSASPPTTVSVDVIGNMTHIMPINPTELISIIKETIPEKDVLYVKSILRVLETDQFKAEYAKMVKSSKLLLISGMLLTVEKLMAKDASIEIDAAIRKYFRLYFAKIKHVQEVLKLITTEKQPSRPLLARLIVAVPAPAENETEIFKQLSLLLQKEQMFRLIEDNIKKENYKNMATLLKAVLSEELKLDNKLSDEEIKAAKYYSDKIQLYGFGEGKILWGVDIDTISQNINVAQVMDNAISFKDLDNTKRKQFNSIITYLRNNPPILQNWDKWIYYIKCGDFTKSLFHLLFSHTSTPPDVRQAISALTPLISYDKGGDKPTFGTKE